MFIYYIFWLLCIYGIIPRLIPSRAPTPVWESDRHATYRGEMEAKWKRFPPTLAHSEECVGLHHQFFNPSVFDYETLVRSADGQNNGSDGPRSIIEHAYGGNSKH